MRVARMERDQRRRQACGLLGPIYGWFTEGFHTLDLTHAESRARGTAIICGARVVSGPPHPHWEHRKSYLL